MKISRQVGTASQILNVYAQDFSVTTGAGIANIPATTVSYSWFRNNHAGVSTGMGVSTASMGTYTSGAWTQINSATALGWYQFCIPNDALLSGDCSALLLRVSTGAFTMAPIPIEIELTKTNNQTYTSSQTIGFVHNGVNVTSFSAAITTNANVLQAYGSAIVTSASGQFRVSTQAIDKGGYGVTTNADKTGYSVTAVSSDVYVGVDWANVTNKAAYNDLSSTFISTNQSIAGASAPTAAQVAQAVWDEIATSHSANSSFAQVLKLGMSNVSTLITGVNVTSFMGTTSPARPGYVGIDWGFVTSKAAYNDLTSTFISTNQSIAGASAPTAAQVAQAVWDEIATSHSASSSFAVVLKNGMSNVSTLITGVNITSIVGTAAVTSAGGQLRVSTQTIDKTGYSVGTGGLAFDSVSSDAWPLWGVLDAGTVGNINTTSFTGSSVVLRSVSSSYPNDTLTGGSIFVYAVTTGAGQRRILTDWTSTNAVGNVDNWLITPTQSTAKYVLFATPPASTSNVPDVNVARIMGTTSPAMPGYVGIDWGFVTTKAAYNDLSSTFISTNQSIAGASAPTAAQVATAVWDEIATSHSVSSSFALVLKIGMSNVSTVMTGVNITSIVGTAAVTSAGGQLRVSTQAIDKGGYGVTTIASAVTTNANLLQIYGSAAVTSAGGQLTVSTQAIDKGGYGVTTIAAAITTNANLMQIYGTAAVTSAGGQLLVSTQALSGISGSVNVSSIMGQPAVTTSAGVLLVSTQAIPTFAVAGDAMALTSGERAAVAGVILTTTQAEGYRSVNAPGSLMQIGYEILANLTEQTASGTTRSIASVTSHVGAVATYQYDSSSSPASITRIT